MNLPILKTTYADVQAMSDANEVREVWLHAEALTKVFRDDRQVDVFATRNAAIRRLGQMYLSIQQGMGARGARERDSISREQFAHDMALTSTDLAKMRSLAEMPEETFQQRKTLLGLSLYEGTQHGEKIRKDQERSRIKNREETRRKHAQKRGFDTPEEMERSDRERRQQTIARREAYQKEREEKSGMLPEEFAESEAQAEWERTREGYIWANVMKDVRAINDVKVFDVELPKKETVRQAQRMEILEAAVQLNDLAERMRS